MGNENLTAAINLRLALLELPRPTTGDGEIGLVEPLLARQRELSRRLSDRLCPADQRIQDFLDDYLADSPVKPQLPRQTLILDQAGLARGLSLPADGDEFRSPLLASYRLANGVLHNPANDRRTTAGVFHVAQGGLPIPDDKIAVRKEVFARLLELAFQPPHDDMVLPFTANQATPAACFVSLLMRPLVVPAVPGQGPARTMETRFIVPGGLVCNLDFVEAIFGNAGDPQLPQNDAALDPTGWSGHTGCVVLAPHLTKMTKKSLGLPPWDEATERERRDGQCWRRADELYNDGKAFKCCARDERGVMVTVIADNYFGYCKKEVKTQLSYAANLLGCAEEEHSGGAQVFPAYNLGQDFHDDYTPADYTIAEVLAREPDRFDPQPEGHALDRLHPHLVLVPGGASYSMREQTVSWPAETGGTQTIKLLAGKVYITPNGYRVYAKHRELDVTQWHLIGVSPISTSCHKPATVSGGGKSEISKSISDAFVFDNAYAADFDDDIRQVQRLLDSDYSDRYVDQARNGKDRRPILSPRRSLGSVIKLLTPSGEYTDDYNHFLRAIPAQVKEILFTVKRYYKPEWGDDWRSHFSVGTMNGRPGNAVRLEGDKIIANQLRVGFQPDGSWRLFTLRPDFSPAIKVQTEDDITASTVAPPFEQAPAGFDNQRGLPRKYVQNCEQLLFQRPDDAIHRGYDKQAEQDLSRPGTFISNFEPLQRADALELMENAQAFSEYTEPMAELVRKVASQAETSPRFWIASDQPRLVGGKRSRNPRYLQVRPDIANPEATAAADLASHLVRKLPSDRFAPLPVDVVAAGRRNNPKEEGVPPLCVYNPLHYMELPELFMEFISSMTGKSPSTTGAGSEGALTKGPFNAIAPIVDLNNNFLAYALTGYDGWLSSAGYIGPKVRVDHDISMLVPELFSRMWPQERLAANLIADGYLDRLTDYEFQGRPVLASRLGYRINARFASTYFGRIFLHPDVVFTEEMLRPELQDEAIFAESMAVIVTTHQRVAQAYFNDGGVELAVPPLRGLLEIMVNGRTGEGLALDDAEFRRQFTREAILASDWYAARLDAKQAGDVSHQERVLARLREFSGAPENSLVGDRLNLAARSAAARAEYERVSSPAYRQALVGTIGRQAAFR